jgi:hypothetical protein
VFPELQRRSGGLLRACWGLGHPVLQSPNAIAVCDLHRDGEAVSGRCGRLMQEEAALKMGATSKKRRGKGPCEFVRSLGATAGLWPGARGCRARGLGSFATWTVAAISGYGSSTRRDRSHDATVD